MKNLPEIKNIDDDYETQKLNEYFQQQELPDTSNTKLIKWKPVAKLIVPTKDRER